MNVVLIHIQEETDKDICHCCNLRLSLRLYRI